MAEKLWMESLVEHSIPVSDNPACCQPGNREDLFILPLLNNSLIQQIFIESCTRHQVLRIQQLTLQIKIIALLEFTPGEGTDNTGINKRAKGENSSKEERC